MSAFIAQNNAVWMVGKHRPWRMSEVAVDSFLDTFEAEGNAELFNSLYAVAQKAYGTNFIPRTSCLRLVVDNDPRSAVSAMFAASLDIDAALAAQAMESIP